MYFCRTATPKDRQYSWQTCAVAPQDLLRNLSSGKTSWQNLVVAALVRMKNRPTVSRRLELCNCYPEVYKTYKPATLLEREQMLVKFLLDGEPEQQEKCLAQNKAVHKAMADASAKRKNSRAAKAAQGDVEDGAGEETEAEQEEDAGPDLPPEIEDLFYAAVDGMEASDLPLADQQRYKGPGQIEARAHKKAKQLLAAALEKLQGSQAADGEQPPPAAKEKLPPQACGLLWHK